MKRIAIFRALQLGDFLCAVPTLRALRSAFPNASVSWIGLPGTEHLAHRFHRYIDEFIPFPGFPGLPEQALRPRATLNFIKRMQERSFDLLLQMQGSGLYANELLALLDAKQLAGFYLEGFYRPNDGGFIPYPATLHETERHLSLIQHLGIPRRGSHLEFPFAISENASSSFGELEPKRYWCVHAGSRGAWRQWPPAFFARMADELMEAGYQVVLTGTSEELPIVDEVKKQMKQMPFVAAGKTGLDELAALLKNAIGLLSNCTGVAHMAYALDTPSVVISMDGEPYRWAPPSNGLHVQVDWTQFPEVDQVRTAIFRTGIQADHNSSKEAMISSVEGKRLGTR